MSLKLITPPTLELVSLADMKLHLRVDHDEEDALIDALTKGAIAHLDGWTGVLGWCIGAQTYVQAYDAFPAGPIRLPVGPLIEVVSVEYADAGAAYATLPAAEYDVDDVSSPGWIVPVGEWPSVEGTNAVRITFRAGHETATHPRLDAVRVIVKLLVGHWYLNREAVVTGTIATEIPISAASLIAAHRRMVV